MTEAVDETGATDAGQRALVVLVDLCGRILELGDEVEAQFGHCTSGWSGASVLDLVHPDDVDVATECLTWVLAGRSSPGPRCHVRVGCTRGRWRWVRWYGFRLVRLLADDAIELEGHLLEDPPDLAA